MSIRPISGSTIVRVVVLPARLLLLAAPVVVDGDAPSSPASRAASASRIVERPQYVPTSSSGSPSAPGLGGGRVQGEPLAARA